MDSVRSFSQKTRCSGSLLVTVTHRQPLPSFCGNTSKCFLEDFSAKLDIFTLLSVQCSPSRCVVYINTLHSGLRADVSTNNHKRNPLRIGYLNSAERLKLGFITLFLMKLASSLQDNTYHAPVQRQAFFIVYSYIYTVH